MNKILKILSILVIGFVMFSCSTPTNDPTPYVPEPSGPETPAPNPAVPTYSITFKVEDSRQQPVADLLNSLPDYKNLKEGTEVELPTVIYVNLETEQLTLELTESSTNKNELYYEGNITSVVIGNEDIEIKCWLGGGWIVVKK
ncbi:hypothetical protein [uncultured Treponema sp.]|uniref:hypothetical protein n=1 Tax=uncultured Treponema sp. TaxID=162155 RepID=UPI002594BC03|nr:hypothetical protein [uncultured Treponema sp.]